MITRKHVFLVPGFAAALLLSACSGMESLIPGSAQPAEWAAPSAKDASIVDAESLHEWWKKFNDPVLAQLIETALKNSPDRNAAEARIREARGDWRATHGSLFPLLAGSADAGRKDANAGGLGNFYDAGFDASYEMDIFGVNRNRSAAADSRVKAAEAGYDDVSLTLVAEVIRNYIQLCAFDEQANIAAQNLDAQKKTLDLIRQQKKVGAAPQLDVERAENLVNTTNAAIPDYQRQAENARLRLTVLTGILPADLAQVIAADTPLPGADVAPVLMAPAQVIASRPDIRAAEATLRQQSDLSDSAFASLFPTFTLSGFYGVEKTALLGPAQIWSVAVGTAVNLLDFGRIQGQVDASKAREAQAYEALRKTVLQAVVDVETALNDYAKITARAVSLKDAQENAHRSLSISQDLYKEGEISFLDVLDAQRTANNADAAVIDAEMTRSLSLVSLYKALGIY